MQLQRVKKTFERKGYTSNAYINKNQYINFLTSLIERSGQFNEEAAQELWLQASENNPEQSVRVIDICMTVVEAQKILRTRIQQANELVNTLEQEKKKLQISIDKDQVRKLESIAQKLEEIQEEKQSYENDYRFVTEPFGIPWTTSSRIKSGADNQIASNGMSDQEQYTDYIKNRSYDPQVKTPQQYQGFAESQELKVTFYLTLVFGFIEIIMIYGKSDFLNLIVFTCLLSIYLMNFFDKPYIRLALALIASSVALDLIWLLMYASTKWNPSTVSNNTIYQIGYMRFIVFFTIVLIPLKISLFSFMFKHRNTENDSRFVISFGLIKIFLSANKTNPISRGLINHTILGV